MNPVMKILENEKGRDREAVKKRRIEYNYKYSDKIIRNKIISYLLCSNIFMDNGNNTG